MEEQEECELPKQTEGWEGFQEREKPDSSDESDGSEEQEPLRECVCILATQPHQFEQAHDMLTSLYHKVSVADFSKPRCGILIGHLIPRIAIFSNGVSAPYLDMRCLGLSLGCVALQPSRAWLHSCEITYTCVARHERDVDLSCILIGAAIALARDMGYDWVFMGRRAYFASEEPFYKRLGFTDKVDSRLSYLSDGEQVRKRG
ncbi:hypothetical protein DSL72_000291 [Monilinia vaccinii-corymbosi]|uniref:N-acetyltransferase domain-containing protein n=1 Tax=Monilinia vaccinii-corymbosi TaxID=61207 RepID=A0A8A3NYW6_9HELO|nr:hypothetical protein DSL72_000291 [Monilinia vaccinii-corymbosi]